MFLSCFVEEEVEYRNKDGNLVSYSVKTKSTRLLVENTTFVSEIINILELLTKYIMFSIKLQIYTFYMYKYDINIII